jgi:hypothetical protein
MANKRKSNKKTGAGAPRDDQPGPALDKTSIPKAKAQINPSKKGATAKTDKGKGKKKVTIVEAPLRRSTCGTDDDSEIASGESDVDGDIESADRDSYGDGDGEDEDENSPFFGLTAFEKAQMLEEHRIAKNQAFIKKELAGGREDEERSRRRRRDQAETSDSEREGQHSRSKKNKRNKKRKGRSSSLASSSEERYRRKQRRRRRDFSSPSSSSDTGESDWEDLIPEAERNAIKTMLATAKISTPKSLVKGRQHFAIDGNGKLLSVKAPRKSNRSEKWMRESVNARAERHAEYKGAGRRLGFTDADRHMKRNLEACREPLHTVEDILLLAPLSTGHRRALTKTRNILFQRLDILLIEKDTNVGVAGLVESGRAKGNDREVAAAFDKWQKSQKGKPTVQGQSGGNAGGGGRSRTRNAPPAQQFPAFPPAPGPAPGFIPFGQRPQRPQRQTPMGACFACHEVGHHKGDAVCKGVKK